jgi:hypothetical protein
MLFADHERAFRTNERNLCPNCGRQSQMEFEIPSPKYEYLADEKCSRKVRKKSK